MIVYYPYLRARMHEVIAVAEAATAMSATGKILPILEPVRTKTTSLRKHAKDFAKARLPVSLVLNPQVGELVGVPNATTQLLTAMRAAGATVIPALIIQQSTSLQEVQDFQSQNKGPQLYLHQGAPNGTVVAAVKSVSTATHIFREGSSSAAYPKGFPNRVLLQDGFKAQATNADYPQSSFFGDLHLTYAGSGFNGFGDYTTIGDRFRDGGGPPKAIVLHMTEDFQAQGISCNHFLSTSNQTPANPAGKFGQAVLALHRHCKRWPGKLDFTSACQELRQAGASGSYPGLGKLKRLSIQHHLELMCTLV